MENDDPMANFRDLLRSAGESALEEGEARLAGTMGKYQPDRLITSHSETGVRVYLARNDDGQRVVVKLLPHWLKESPELQKRFFRESRTIASLANPHIVTFLDFGKTPEDYPFMVMEYVTGGSIADQIAEGTRFEPEQAVRIMADVCLGLQALHENGIVHRDIKPGNILLAEDGVPKLCDFGLAKVLGAQRISTSLTSSNDRMGTYGFMAPEQLISSKKVDARADIFSLGAVLYYMLIGTWPGGTVPLLSTTRPELKAYDHVVAKALASDPAQRYPTALAFREALLGSTRKLSRRRVLVFASGGLAMAGVSGFMVFQSRGENAFWAAIDEARRALPESGKHEVELPINDRLVRFAVTRSAPFEIEAIDVPTLYQVPIAASTQVALRRHGVPVALITKLTQQSLAIILPDFPDRQIAFVNGSPEFAAACKILSLIESNGLFVRDPEHLQLDPAKVADFPQFCEQLGVPTLPIADLDEQAALRRVAIYEALRHPDMKRHPFFSAFGPVQIANATTRSRLEVLAALIVGDDLYVPGQDNAEVKRAVSLLLKSS